MYQEIVGPFQNSFMAGQHSPHLTQELVHTIRSRKGKRGDMILKIDLHKAFDSVNWVFLKQVLKDFGFPDQIIEIIMFSITSMNLEILWNGEPMEKFKPGRGLRQGDPLSPYLFILVMEKLSHQIQQKVSDKKWKQVAVTRGGPSFSHLFFADDLMLFAEASSEQVTCIKDCIDTFAEASGLEINYDKSLALLVSICRDIDIVNKNFLWGHNSNSRKCLLVAWDAVCQKRDKGGLGIRKARDMNLALLSKSAWKIHSGNNGPWCKAVTSKYCRNSQFLQVQAKGKEALAKGLIWSVGSGHNIDFWDDKWTPSGPLRSHSTSDQAQLQNVVADFITGNRMWDLSSVEHILPREVIREIKSIPISLNTTGSLGKEMVEPSKFQRCTTSLRKTFRTTSMLMDRGNGFESWNAAKRLGLSFG